MKTFVSRIGFLSLILSLLASAHPVLAQDGVIGTPPANPDPAGPSLQYAGCDGRVVSANNSTFEQQVIALVNQERTGRGLTPLKRSDGLTNAARYQATDMSQDNYFSHDTMDRESGNLVKKCGPWERIANYYSGASGENAAAGYNSPEAVMNGWMNSAGHRANILNPGTRTIGVGFYQGSGDYQYYWVQDFGTKIDTPVTPVLGFVPEELVFLFSIPDQKLYPSHQHLTVENVGTDAPLSWQVTQKGTFFSVTPGNGTSPAQVRVAPDNFNHNQVNTYTGQITINITSPTSVAGSPHTSQIKLMVVNAQVEQVFLPGVFR
jgi:uncharacterized protein YkwD